MGMGAATTPRRPPGDCGRSISRAGSGSGWYTHSACTTVYVVIAGSRASRRSVRTPRSRRTAASSGSTLDSRQFLEAAYAWRTGTGYSTYIVAVAGRPWSHDPAASGNSAGVVADPRSYAPPSPLCSFAPVRYHWSPVRQPVPFGKYLLLDRISVGGMAEVFKAKSYGVEGFEKFIAIKRILPTMGEDRDFIKMFIDEAKIAGQLAHANICQIFELGRIDGSHFIAMEYIWGKDLLQIQNRLRKIKQAMPVSMACFSIAKVLEGLDYAHRKRDPLGRPLEIVHRDCSPQNVLVSYEGEVKVIDFGIAKATSRNSRTMAGVLKGKFGYMSPEQVRGLPLDRRSDIFALGTMLYECLTGDRLFQGETDFSTLEKVRNVDIRPPRELNPDIPLAVEAVIMKALAKDVDERYQWCSEMLADLQAFLMGQDVVFTAKTLSSWLKEVFAAEIDRERQQLEQYKRVGRDGLFAGVPAAEAKVDVIETLGEAGPVEGDPTVLGGPSFDDIEQAAGAAPEVGPAPGSPATRASSVGDDDDGSEEFGEEAPTEIFGEINHGANPVPGGQPRPPSGLPSLHRPPRPP